MVKKSFNLFILFFIGGCIFSSFSHAATLFTPFTGISVTPGETIDYSVQLINDESGIFHTTFEMKNLPEDWTYTITSEGHEIEQLAVLGNESQQLTLEVQVPLQVEKGRYSFEFVANGLNGQTASLPFLVNVTEEGTFKTELTSEQPNMEGHAEDTFSYQVTLNNRTADEQHYSLSADAPNGWDVQFKIDDQAVTAATLEANSTKSIHIDITPPENVKADTYNIPIKAVTSSTSATTELEAVVTGSYALELTTPSGMLSTNITAGREKAITLQLKNEGTVAVRDITLTGEVPPNWDIHFEEDTIAKIEAGQSVDVKATLTAHKDAIAGDYIVQFQANSPEAPAEMTYRVSVETSVLWGFVGMLIIIGVIGGMYFLFKKYGRR